MGSIPQRDCRRFTRRFLNSADLKVKRTIARSDWRSTKARQIVYYDKPRPQEIVNSAFAFCQVVKVDATFPVGLFGIEARARAPVRRRLVTLHRTDLTDPPDLKLFHPDIAKLDTVGVILQ